MGRGQRRRQKTPNFRQIVTRSQDKDITNNTAIDSTETTDSISSEVAVNAVNCASGGMNPGNKRTQQSRREATQLKIPKGYKLVREGEVDSESDNESDSESDNESDSESDNESDSESDIESVSNLVTKSKPRIQIYKGLGDKVSIENWLKRYKMLATFYKWNESQKIVMIGNYLEDDALNWFIGNY
jgi:hypothetical protein